MSSISTVDVSGSEVMSLTIAGWSCFVLLGESEPICLLFNEVLRFLLD